MLKGFRDFILRGNVIELAVAVVIGSAFTNIVTAFTNKIINPLIASLGSTEVKGLGFQIRPGVAETFVDSGCCRDLCGLWCGDYRSDQLPDGGRSGVLRAHRADEQAQLSDVLQGEERSGRNRPRGRCGAAHRNP